MTWDVHFVKVTGSTNTDVLQAGLQGAPEGFAVVAEEQKAGRGRMNRSWFSPPGAGLYASVLVRPRIGIGEAGLLSFCAANAMRAAIAEAGLETVRIKWPNDLVAGGKKICGILSSCRTQEGRLDFAVIGLGVNLGPGSYPEELKDRAGCLAEMGVTPDRVHAAPPPGGAMMTPPGMAGTPARPAATPHVGRNDPCPCGSGKKYKKCCGRNLF